MGGHARPVGILGGVKKGKTMPNHAEQLAQELNLNVKNVQGAIELID